MAQVYGTDNSEVIDWFDGVTDGNDTIFGYNGEDWIFAGKGNDILLGGAGPDHLDGGDGYDTASYVDSAARVIVNLATGEGHEGTAEGDTFFSIENLTGSVFNDSLTGNAYDNVLSGLWGDDSLEGGGGADVLDGSWGVDTASYAHSPAGVTVCLLWNSASGGDASGDQLIGIENLTGSKYNDGLFGDNGPNVLRGAGGSDTLLGFGGPDILFGDGRGFIGAGADSLNGGAGNDLLVGGVGGDTLCGGPDADVFLWNDAIESAGVIPSGIDLANTDVILDFNAAEGDIIAVHDVDADEKSYGNQDFTFIGEYWAHGGFTAPGQATYGFDGTNTYLLFNTDDVYTAYNGVADFEFGIRLPGQYAPQASWFNL
jgi:Ca2+-binding RTX toxin-like protein